jgi:flavodoxin
MAKSKILIAYYSRKGQNYLNGSIVTLPVGNTEVAAKIAQKITGGNIFEICTVKSYPIDYTETTEVATVEKRNNARPELSSRVNNMNQYDTVILGYPNWWGTFPMAVFTFLEEYDFSRKTILPFSTHEGSGLGSSERDIRKLCPGATVLPGLAIRGGSIGRADQLVANWLKSIIRPL